MKYKTLHLAILFTFFTTIAMAQNKEPKMSDTQKADAAKADVYIINSKRKITDSFVTASKETTITGVKKTKRNACAKQNKKSS